MADLDAARGQAQLLWHFGLKAGGVMHLFGRGIERGALINQMLQVAVPVLIGARRAHLDQITVTEDFAFARIGQHDELVAQITADRTCVSAHRHDLEAHAGIEVQIGHKHPVIGPLGRGLVDVERIGVLHQELPAPHDAKARTLLVPELPLHVIEVLGQVLIGAHGRAENARDHLFIGWPIEQLALMTVDNAQHLRPIGVIAPRLAPQVRKLQGRHQDLDGTGPVHLLTDNLLDLAQDPMAQRQPRIDPRSLLPDHASAQHQSVRDDLRLRRGFFENRKKIARQAHDNIRGVAEGGSHSPASAGLATDWTI